MRFFICKTLTLLAFLIGIAFQANAQGTNVNLIVTLANGEETTYQLSEESQLYFENGVSLVVDDGKGNVVAYPLNQIRKMVCSEILGTDENTVSRLRLFPNPSHNTFTIIGLQSTQPACIYALDGRLVKEFEASEGVVIDIDDLPQGMYLLHISSQTLKLMKL